MTTAKTPRVRSYLVPVLMMTVGAVLFVYGVTHGGCRP